MRLRNSLDGHVCRFDLAGFDARCLCRTARQRIELHCLEKGDELGAVLRFKAKILDADIDRRICLQSYQLA